MGLRTVVAQHLHTQSLSNSPTLTTRLWTTVAIHLHTKFLSTDCGLWTAVAVHLIGKVVAGYSEVAPMSF